MQNSPTLKWWGDDDDEGLEDLLPLSPAREDNDLDGDSDEVSIEGAPILHRDNSTVIETKNRNDVEDEEKSDLGDDAFLLLEKSHKHNTNTISNSIRKPLPTPPLNRVKKKTQSTISHHMKQKLGSFDSEDTEASPLQPAPTTTTEQASQSPSGKATPPLQVNPRQRLSRSLSPPRKQTNKSVRKPYEPPPPEEYPFHPTISQYARMLPRTREPIEQRLTRAERQRQARQLVLNRLVQQLTMRDLTFRPRTSQYQFTSQRSTDVLQNLHNAYQKTLQKKEELKRKVEQEQAAASPHVPHVTPFGASRPTEGAPYHERLYRGRQAGSLCRRAARSVSPPRERLHSASPRSPQPHSDGEADQLSPRAKVIPWKEATALDARLYHDAAARKQRLDQRIKREQQDRKRASSASKMTPQSAKLMLKSFEEELYKAVDAVDPDGKGRLDRHQVAEVLRLLGLFKSYEVHNYRTRLRAAEEASLLHRMFALFDTDADGLTDFASVTQFLTKMLKRKLSQSGSASPSSAPPTDEDILLDDFIEFTRTNLAYKHTGRFRLQAEEIRAEPDKHPYKPSINDRSREIEANSTARLLLENAGTLSAKASHRYEILLHKARLLKQKKEQAAKKAENSLLTGCTFQPQLSPRTADLKRQLEASRSERWFEALHKQGQKLRSQHIEDSKLTREAQEVKAYCTFSPQIVESQAGWERVKSISPTRPPKGFADTVHRLRQAQREKEYQAAVKDSPSLPKPEALRAQPFHFAQSRKFLLHEKQKPLLYVDVKLGAKGKGGRIGIHAHSDLRQLAESFGKCFQLDAEMTSRLEQLLVERWEEYCRTAGVPTGQLEAVNTSAQPRITKGKERGRSPAGSTEDSELKEYDRWLENDTPPRHSTAHTYAETHEELDKWPHYFKKYADASQQLTQQPTEQVGRRPSKHAGAR